MSPTKLKSLLTGAFFAITIALASSVVAGDLRFFSPYTCQSFGGGRRGHDGVYGSLTGVYWSISAPRGGFIGATTAKGNDETRWVYDGRMVREQTNSVKINLMDPTTTLGTRLEVGNRRGHHGWLFSCYGLPRQNHHMSVQNMTMTIRDEGNFSIQTFVPPGVGPGGWGAMHLPPFTVIWDREHNTLQSPVGNRHPMFPAFADWQVVNGVTAGSLDGIGYLWGYFHHSFEDDGANYVVAGVFAPLPIWFSDVDISVSSSHRSGELMYTYRPHPFTWGSMELLAGARYWEFDDRFGFHGRGPTDDADDAEGGAIGSNISPAFGPISVLADMTINARGHNRIFGPQIGMKLQRHNARWTFGAEGRFTGGINAQAVRTQGNIATNFNHAGNYWTPWFPVGQPDPGEELPISSYTPQWTPVGLQFNNTNFGHRQNKTYFSPILEGRLSADWQWTSAVSFFGAVNGMFADNISRGYRITDYVVQSDGTIFGLRGNDRNTHVFVYGVEMGVRINR